MTFRSCHARLGAKWQRGLERRRPLLAGLIPVPGQTFAAHLAENPDALTFAATLSADGGRSGSPGSRCVGASVTIAQNPLRGRAAANPRS